MVNTSTEYLNALYDGNRAYVPRVKIQLKDNTILELTGNQIMQGGIKIDDGISGQGSFDVGSAIINKLTLNINNMYDEYSTYNFTDAIITVFVGLQLTDRIEWLKKGVFNADDPTSTQGIITVEGLDNMVKFDKQYDGKIIFPATLQAIVNYCCTKCGVLLNTFQFDNYAYKINKNPFEENEPATYRELISYCAQIAGCYARCNADGKLELKWYDTVTFPLDVMDGGNFKDYKSGSSADGGNFKDYASGTLVDGGDFKGLKKYHHIYSLSSMSIAIDDVVITGISVTASDGKKNKNTNEILDGESSLSGNLGYVLKVQGNPLIEYGRAKEVAKFLGNKIIGMKFRPMNISALSEPSIEVGDCAIVTDRKSNSYFCYVTNLTYSIGNYEIFSCDAETPLRNSSQKYGALTKAAVESRKNTQKQLSQYDLAAQQLGSIMAHSMGLYQTQVVNESDGSVIKYMHDKPIMEDSVTIWKQTLDAFAVSTDGGKTWNAGLDKGGNILATVLTAIGVNADWIKAGTITVGGIKDVPPQLKLLDKNGVLIALLDENGLDLKKGSISGSKINNGNGTFSVDEYGKVIANSLTSNNAYITGGTMNVSLIDSYTDVITLRSNQKECILGIHGLNIYYKDHNYTHKTSYYYDGMSARTEDSDDVCGVTIDGIRSTYDLNNDEVIRISPIEGIRVGYKCDLNCSVKATVVGRTPLQT